LWEHPTALPLVILTAVFAFVGGVFLVATAGFALADAPDGLGLGTGGFGYLLVAFGAGSALGIATVGRAKQWTRSDWLPFVQLIAVGVLLGLLSMTSRVWVAVPLLAGIGAVGATVLIPIDAKLQEQVDDQRRGAVFAARGMVTSVAMVLAFWLQFGTALFRRASAPAILFWLGIGSVAAAVFTLLAVLVRRARAAA
jgi:hypothetical protein